MSGLTSLHKILKDETRQKIIMLLNEKGGIGYTELLDTTEAGSTGLLNYHLKVLGNLITKNETGQYILTEKGKLASRLLAEFPEEDYQLQKRKRLKQFWIAAAISQIIFLISTLTVYYLNYVDFGRFVLYTLFFIGGVGLAYLGYRVQNGKLMLVKDEKKRVKMAFMTIGGMIGLVTAFLGPIIVIVLARYAGGIDLAHAEGGELWVFLIIIGLIFGAIAGYYKAKRRDFTLPSWMT